LLQDKPDEVIYS